MAACPPPIRRQVSDHVGPVKHMTRSHVQPFHNNCESVDLWAAGIILMDMLVIGTIGQVFQVRPPPCGAGCGSPVCNSAGCRHRLLGTPQPKITPPPPMPTQDQGEGPLAVDLQPFVVFGGL